MVPPARRYLKGHFNGIITHPWCSLVPLFTVLCATGTFIMGLASCYCLFSFFNILVLLCLLPWCFFLGILCLFFFIHFLSLLIRGLTQNFLPSMWRITACRWHRPSYFWISNLSTLRRIPLGISSEIFVQQLKASGNKLNHFSLSDHILWDSFKQISVEEDISWNLGLWSSFSSPPLLLGFWTLPSHSQCSLPPVFLSLMSSSFFVNIWYSRVP